MSEPSHRIHIDRIACPLHVLALKKGLAKVAAGELLKVTTGGASVSHELVAACHSLGCPVEIQQDTLLLVRRPATADTTEMT